MGQTHHLTIRVDEDAVDLIDDLGRQWGLLKENGEVNRSETLRLLIDSYGGVLNGRFFAIVDHNALANEWGSVGAMLAAASEGDGEHLSGMDEARLGDVLKPLPDLVGAGRISVGEAPDLSNGDP